MKEYTACHHSEKKQRYKKIHRYLFVQKKYRKDTDCLREREEGNRLAGMM